MSGHLDFDPAEEEVKYCGGNELVQIRRVGSTFALPQPAFAAIYRLVDNLKEARFQGIRCLPKRVRLRGSRGPLSINKESHPS